ncbi:Pyridoxamine 5'-phosphate oxidase-related FMN-binding protein [Stackebrandtia soli]
MDSYPQSPLTTSMRSPEKLTYDHATVHAILDEGYICHVAYVADGLPRVLPTAYGRIGHTIYIHGSTGSRAFLTGRDEGLDISLSVTLHDGVILSTSWFHHSANYRCVIAHGRARTVTEPDEKWAGLAAIVDALAPERSLQSREPTTKELAQTAVLALDLESVSVRSRSGGPNDDPDDIGSPYWAGEIPLRLVPGAPRPAPHAHGTPPTL